MLQSFRIQSSNPSENFEAPIFPTVFGRVCYLSEWQAPISPNFFLPRLLSLRILRNDHLLRNTYLMYLIIYSIGLYVSILPYIHYFITISLISFQKVLVTLLLKFWQFSPIPLNCSEPVKKK